MLGAIAGDIIGSPYERHPIKRTDFSLFAGGATFTDDSVLTVAVAFAILQPEVEYGAALKRFGRRYPRAGYGGNFRQWLMAEESVPYNSWGNGSAMRASPVGWAFDSRAQVLAEAAASAAVSHNHPEGIKGAQAVALAVYLARKGTPKETMRAELAERFDYDLARTVDQIRPDYHFDVSCQGSVPEALVAFFDSDGVEAAIRLAISLGGDSDTLACIAGAVAHAYYGGLPRSLTVATRRRLPADLLTVVDNFCREFDVPVERKIGSKNDS